MIEVCSVGNSRCCTHVAGKMATEVHGGGGGGHKERSQLLNVHA
jgi:hypothetical protein